MSISLATWKGTGWCRWCNQIAMIAQAPDGKVRISALCRLHLLRARVLTRKRKQCQPWQEGKRGRPPLVSYRDSA